MKKAKGIPYEEKLMNALKKLPNPIYDKRHDMLISFIDDMRRSNESRFEHIIASRHRLKVSDLERIPKGIKKCIFKKDIGKEGSYSIYIKRYGYTDYEYIKLAIQTEPDDIHKAYVKTIFITKIIK